MRLYNTLTRSEEPFAPGPGNTRAHVHLRPHGLRARAHRQLPDVRLPRRAAPHAEVSARLRGEAGDELHRRRRPHDCRRAEGRHGPAQLHRPVHRGVSRGLARAGPRGSRGDAAGDRRSESPGDGRSHRRAREERPHLRQRRIGLLQDRDAARLRQAGAPRSRGHEGRARASTRTTTRKTTRATSCCGRRPSPTSRPGTSSIRPAGRAGTSSARRWRCACSASRRSTSTAAASI